MKIRKDDKVKILLGKERGKTGKVVNVLIKKGKVLVENINVVKRHIKKAGQGSGKEIEITKPLDISNVALICPKCSQVTRIGFRVEGDKKIRICKKCQEVII